MKTFLLVLVAGLLLAQGYAKTLAESEQQEVEDIEETEGSDTQGGYSNAIEDPCASHHCHSGHECDLDEDDKPVCVCIHVCPRETDDRAKACSTQNVTFDSECELYRQKCLCHRNNPGCLEAKFRHAHLDYFGVCKEIPPCEGWELEEYPNRMRQWLYLVMEELSRRNDLNTAEQQMAEEAQKHNKNWVLPVIWKFCDLDSSHDHLISSEELLPITAPLKPLEHCTGPFLEHCDADKDGRISLQEWGKCLGLDPEEIEDRCEDLKN